MAARATLLLAKEPELPEEIRGVAWRGAKHGRGMHHTSIVRVLLVVALHDELEHLLPFVPRKVIELQRLLHLLLLLESILGSNHAPIAYEVVGVCIRQRVRSRFYAHECGLNQVGG